MHYRKIEFCENVAVQAIPQGFLPFVGHPGIVYQQSLKHVWQPVYIFFIFSIQSSKIYDCRALCSLTGHIKLKEKAFLPLGSHSGSTLKHAWKEFCLSAMLPTRFDNFLMFFDSRQIQGKKKI